MQMNYDKWLCIGTDKRLSTCSEMLAERGYESYHIATDDVTEQLVERIKELSPQHIVFPVLQLKGTLSPTLLTQGTQLYTGVVSDDWLAPFKETGFTVHSYLKDEQFIWQNARLTAEGFVHDYYARVKRQLAGTHFYVAGFGKVGKMTAHVLASLGASVTVIARSATQLGEAAALGYRVKPLTNDCIPNEGNFINTIPAQWFSVSENSKLFIYDLASAPGCLKKNLAPEYYTVLLGLPGKHFPVDAAAALADALERMYRR